MNSKDFQDILKESKGILQERTMDDLLAKDREKHDREYYEKYDKKSLMDIIHAKIDQIGEVVDNPNIIIDKVVGFLNDMKGETSQELKDYRNIKRP